VPKAGPVADPADGSTASEEVRMTTPSDSEICRLYRRASAEFTDRAHHIGDRWGALTPCPGWDVRELVHHLVEEERWAPPLFAGETVDQVGGRFDGDLLGDDLVAALDGAEAAAVAAVTAQGALERTVHLSFGDHPGREYAMQLAADHLVHAWDLARAIGADEDLDPAAVDVVRSWFVTMEPRYRELGVIGPQAVAPAGSGAQGELLAMFGRAR
jgi:uncharacterized protein (TIGR03086 family)